MKISARRSFFLILAALIFFVRTALSQGSNGFCHFRASFLPKSRMLAKAMLNV